MFHHIMLATDGSEPAASAARCGVQLAKSLGARVLGFHVAPPFSSLSYLVEVLGTPQRDFEAAMAAHAQRYLADIAHMAEMAGVPCATEYCFAPHAHQAIVDVACARECDLIVLGARGRHIGSLRLLGSVAHRVLLHAPMPVLVCP